MRLSAGQMRADGTAPGCMGWNDAQNTGWVGTDWIEEFVLSEAGPDVYDEWVDHDIAFDDPQIIKAFDAFKRTVLADGQTYGGTRTIINTNFGESITPEFSSPPKCFWHRRSKEPTSELQSLMRN